MKPIHIIAAVCMQHVWDPYVHADYSTINYYSLSLV